MTAPRVVAVTFETDANHPGLRRLCKSLVKWGWDYQVVLEPRWKGFGFKFKSIAGRCRQLGDAYDWAVSIDSRDFVAVGPPTDFQPPPVPLLLSTEENCWQSPVARADYPSKPGVWRFAHSPFTIDLRRCELLRDGEVADTDDDQRHCHRLYLEGGRGEVDLDYDCRVVQSIAFNHPWTDYFAVEGDRVRNLKTGSLPLAIHANGGTAMDWVPGCGD